MTGIGRYGLMEDKVFSKADGQVEKSPKADFPWYEILRYGLGYPKKNSLLKNLKMYFMSFVAGQQCVRLETSSMCQLRCPACPTGTRSIKDKEVGWGYLKFEDFRKFVDNNSSVRNIELSNWGEIFLNPDLKDIIRYAAEKNISLTANNGVNLNSANDDILEALVKHKFRRMMVSIDGASNETYSIYRRGGNFDKVIANVRKINHYKKMHHSKYPKLSWQFVIFGHNEHELPKAERMAKGLGMRFLPKLNHTPSYSPVNDRELVKKYTGTGASSSPEFRELHGRPYLKPCVQLWLTPQINWDGKLLGCCINKDVSFGNVFEKGLKECLEGEDYAYMKRMAFGLAEPRKDLPCHKCAYFDHKTQEKVV